VGETRKLAAILAADVVGYSRLMGEDETGTAKIVRERREAATPIVRSFGGRLVKTTASPTVGGLMGGCYPWYLLTPEERKARNAAATKNRRFHLPAVTPLGAAASRAWYFSQPPETRAFIINRILVAKVRAEAAKRGFPQPIVYEQDIDRRDDGTLIVDLSKISDANPDPAVYRAQEGGGFIDRAREDEWINGSPAIQAARAQQERRRARRKARREARKAREAAQAGPIDITPPKTPDGKG
jgi:hypothetical protein